MPNITYVTDILVAWRRNERLFLIKTNGVECNRDCPSLYIPLLIFFTVLKAMKKNIEMLCAH